MTDHFKAATDCVEQVRLDQGALDLAYARGATKGAIAGLHHSIGVELKLADVHASLAVVQALDAVRLAQ